MTPVESRYDQGGCFIVNGVKRSLVTQEKVFPNIIQVHDMKGSRFSYQANALLHKRTYLHLLKLLFARLNQKLCLR